MISVERTLKILLTLVLFSICLFWARVTIAETMYPIITYQCSPGSDVAVITNRLLKDGTGKTFNYSDIDGTYSPWDLVEIDRTSQQAKIIKTSKITKTCKLSSGIYTLTIEPQLFGRDLSGRCGESISAAVTVTYDGIDILERTPLEDFCKGNAPVIIRITTFGKTSEVKIKRIPKYKFY